MMNCFPSGDELTPSEFSSLCPVAKGFMSRTIPSSDRRHLVELGPDPRSHGRIDAHPRGQNGVAKLAPTGAAKRISGRRKRFEHELLSSLRQTHPGAVQLAGFARTTAVIPRRGFPHALR